MRSLNSADIGSEHVHHSLVLEKIRMKIIKTHPNKSQKLTQNNYKTIEQKSILKQTRTKLRAD